MKLLVFYCNVGMLPTKKAHEFSQDAFDKLLEKLSIKDEMKTVCIMVRDGDTRIEVFDL